LGRSSVAKPSNEFDFSRSKSFVRLIFDRFVDLFRFSWTLFGQMQDDEARFRAGPSADSACDRAERRPKTPPKV
jgi:hypothetical protein